MQIIAGSPQTGKTTKLIQNAAQLGGYIVCINIQEAQRIQLQSIKMGLSIPFPITYKELVERKFLPAGVRKIHIDNVDMLLSQMLSPMRISTATISLPCARDTALYVIGEE